MTGWYYISYMIVRNGQQSGFGSIELELAGVPRPGSAAQDLSGLVTNISHERGTLAPDTGVFVLGWSEMAA